MYYDDEKLMRIRANREWSKNMSEEKKPNIDTGFIENNHEIDLELEGITMEEVGALCEEITALIKGKNCNALLVVQGETGAMCISEGKIVPTKALHVMQLICAGVFSGIADNDERHILSAVSDSLAKKLGAGQEIPKIIYN